MTSISREIERDRGERGRVLQGKRATLRPVQMYNAKLVFLRPFLQIDGSDRSKANAVKQLGTVGPGVQ